MTGCCAFGCTNKSEKGHQSFTIPNGKNDQQRRRIWIANIQRREKLFSSKTLRLCEAHFEESCFEKNFPYKKLKPNAIPTIFSHSPKKKPARSPKKRIIEDCSAEEQNSQDDNKRICLAEHGYASSYFLPDSRPETLKIELPVLPEPIIERYIYVLEDATPDPQLTPRLQLNPDPRPPPNHRLNPDPRPPLDHQLLTDPLLLPPDPRLPPTHQQMQRLKTSLATTRQTVTSLKKKIKTMEDKLKHFLNPDQLENLQTEGNKTWSKDTVDKALKLRGSCGIAGYQLLLEYGFPLPSDRTLRRKIQPDPTTIYSP